MVATTNQGLILPDGTDNANVPLTFTDFVLGATGMENRLVQRYLSIADRTARNPAPNEGELSYLADLNRYDTYTGAAWTPLFASPVQDYSATGGLGINSPTYTTVGITLVGQSYVVPASGQLRVDFGAVLDNTAANATFIAPQLNTGGIVGGGVAIVSASDAIAIRNRGTDEIQTSGFAIYTGLTPGNTVNAFLMFRTTGISANITELRLVLSQA